MSFGSSLRNRELVDRCRGLEHMWRALRRSPGCLSIKARVLWQCFWPKALHAVSTCLLGTSHINRLRTAAVKALQLGSAGGNPMLRLMLSFPLESDPGFYQVCTVLRTFRRLCQKQPAHVAEWRLFMARYTGKLLPGPFSKLLEVVAPLGWTVLNPPTLSDHDGFQFDLLGCSSGELMHRLEDAWAQSVAKQQQRGTMAGLESGIDLACTIRKRSSRSALQARQVAAIGDGSFRASVFHAKFDLSKSSECSVCHVPNDYRHQVAHCPLFTHCREADLAVAQQWDEFPPCVSNHLLVPRSPVLRDLKEALLRIPDTTADFQVSPHDGGPFHLFSDGSCFHHEDVQLTTAAWAVVQQRDDRLDCIAAGHVPGIVQSVNRAELTAAISAVRWALDGKCSICLWTDSKYVSSGLQILLGGTRYNPGENQDLWMRLAQYLEFCYDGQVSVQWIPSHLSVSSCDSPFEEWIASGNAGADTAAVLANRNRSVQFQATHSAAVAHFRHWSRICSALERIYLKIAQTTSLVFVEPEEDPAAEPDTVASCAMTRQSRDGIWADRLPLCWQHELFSQLPGLPPQFVTSFVEWLLHLDGEAEGLTEISLLELVLYAHSSAGIVFPASAPSGQFVMPCDAPFFRPTVTHLLRIAQQVVSQLSRSFDLPGFLCRDLDRSPLGVFPPQKGVKLGCSDESVQAMRQVLASFAFKRQVRTAADLARPI